MNRIPMGLSWMNRVSATRLESASSTQNRRHRTPVFAANPGEFGENAEIVQALSSAAGQNAFERFGVESEAP
ncbi:hypothetical protein E4U11_001134, partial [Claviceps purpurea]